MDNAEQVAPAARKRERNRRDYERSKKGGEHVLLRLDPGGSAALDAAANAAGLSRAAFARIFLPAIIAAVGSRYLDIERARAGSSSSLAQFLASAIEQALSPASNRIEAAPLTEAASEFDRLFGAEG